MQLVPIRTSQRFSDAAYEAIRTNIRAGIIFPGTRIYEGEIATALGISKTPVREALNRLASDGLVVDMGNAGAYVARLSDEEILQLYEAREVLEPPLARMAARNATEKDVSLMADALREAQVASEAGDMYALTESDSQFHVLIAAAAGNCHLLEARERLDNRIAIARVLSLARMRRQGKSIYEHEYVLEAISNRDAESAERLMLEHIRNIRLELIDWLASTTNERRTEANA